MTFDEIIPSVASQLTCSFNQFTEYIQEKILVFRYFLKNMGKMFDFIINNTIYVRFPIDRI